MANRFKSNKINAVWILLLSILSAILFVCELGDRSNIFTWMAEAINERGFEVTLIAVGLFLMYYFIFLKEGFCESKFKGEKLLGGFISVCFLFGDACVSANGLSPVWSNFGQITKSILLLFAYFFLALAGTRWLNYLLCRFSSDKTVKPRFYDKHPFIVFFLLILALWLPQIVFKFPGTMCYDNYNQIAQYYGYIDISSNHPTFHTLLLGLCFDFGLLFSSANLGLFTATMIQSLLLAAIFAYTLVIMIRMKCPAWIIILSIVFYTVTPNIIGYISIPLKDVPYSAFCVLFTASLVNLVIDEEKFWHSKMQVFLLIISGALAILLRNNGLLAIVPISVYLGIRSLRNKKINAASRIRRVCAVLSIFVITVSVNLGINLYFDPVSGSGGEAFSFPFQQTARYVRDHPEDVTEEEAKIINAILDYENLGELYDPRICDPVKATFKNESTPSDMLAYFGVWAKHFFRHPLTYVEATVSQNYTLFYPQVNNIKYYPSVKTHNELQPLITQTKGLSGIKAFDPVRNNMTRFYTFLHNMPVIGTLSNLAFYTLLLLALWAFKRHHKIKGMGLVLSMPLLTVLMCIFAPVILLQSRYAFPMAYAMPIVVASYLFLYRRTKEEEERMNIPVTDNLTVTPFEIDGL